MSTEQRKVLEEIQKTKSLLKQGAAAALGLPGPFPSGPPTTNNHFVNVSQVQVKPLGTNLSRNKTTKSGYEWPFAFGSRWK